MFCGPQSSSSRFTLFHTTTISHWQQIHLLTLTTNILSHIRKYENQPGCRDSADCWKASIIIILQFSNSIIKGKPKTLQCIWWEIILYITVPPYIMNIRTFVAKSRTFVAKSEITHFFHEITHFCREITPFSRKMQFGTFPKIHPFWDEKASLNSFVRTKNSLNSLDNTFVFSRFDLKVDVNMVCRRLRVGLIPLFLIALIYIYISNQ